jgi:hypothetical protein
MEASPVDCPVLSGFCKFKGGPFAMVSLDSLALIAYLSALFVSFPIYVSEILEIMPGKYRLVGILFTPLAPIILLFQGILVGVPMFIHEVLFDKSKN